MGRRYRDADGVVHDASDLNAGNNITQCEREHNQEWYDTRELRPTEAPTTCLLCLVVPEWRRKMTGQ